MIIVFDNQPVALLAKQNDCCSRTSGGAETKRSEGREVASGWPLKA